MPSTASDTANHSNVLVMERPETLECISPSMDAADGCRREVHHHTRQPSTDRLAIACAAVARDPHEFVHCSATIRAVLDQIDQVAPTNATVLLLGETGVGKEFYAEAIHEASTRHQRQMIRINCAALPPTLIESELFGHERGAFTGALARQVGRFEAASGSTLFLDEIAEMTPETQVKLLRVLEAHTIVRLGSSVATRLDVRVIAATNRNLEDAVASHAFREDLFYRLNVFPITIPPLRERVSDIPGLVWTFIHECSRSMGKKIDGITPESLAALQRYDWPGNIRELRNVIERDVILAKGSTLAPNVPRGGSLASRHSSQRLVDVQAEHIKSVLETCRWRIRSIDGAATRLGMKPTTLESRMARLGIERPSLS